jgi:hypothetical protein
MDWEIVGSTGEWVGAIAVVATLFYLARQIKQQNALARYTAWQSLFVEFNGITKEIGSDPIKGPVFWKGMEGLEEFDDIQVRQWEAMVRTYYNTMLIAFRGYRSGFLEPSEWSDLARSFAAFMSSPGGEAWRQSNNAMFPEFWEEVDTHHTPHAAPIDYSIGQST